jgi:hypothetical protein
MLATGAESLRKETLKVHSAAIEAADFPRVLACLIAEYCIPYDVEFQPYLPNRLPENRTCYVAIRFDAEYSSVTGMITVGDAPGRLNQTLRTIYKPYRWLTWIGTQPVSAICRSWTIEFDQEIDEYMDSLFAKTCVGIATRESIDRFSGVGGTCYDIYKYGGYGIYTGEPNVIRGVDGPTETPLLYECKERLEEDWFFGSYFGEANDRITISIRQTSATLSAISFTSLYSSINQRRIDTDIAVLPTAELRNYVPFITTCKRVRLLVSSSD